MSGEKRIEKDSMGEVRVPVSAYWGAQTQRAVDNFPVSPLRIPVPMIRAFALIKGAAAETNKRLGLLDEKLADAIVAAAAEAADGRWDGHFPVDVFQTGSGTSWNMNVNEVIGNRANEMLGSPLGSRKPVHPNDHVNLGQSSNDVVPSAINIADRLEAVRLVAALDELARSLEKKAMEWEGIVKIGRTHLQDAVPMTLGQEFSGYARQIRNAAYRVSNTYTSLEELALGGTALGTGLNAHPEFGRACAELVAERTGIPFRQAPNLFEAIAARDAQAELAGTLNGVAIAFMKIAQDLRLLASGPRAGFAEIALPSLQPGSSIMPGKVNPVIPEMTIQAAAHVMGQTVAVTIACQNAPLELNIMQPLLAYETLSALDLLTATANILREKCIDGLAADEAKCLESVEKSLALATPLALKIGYDRCAQIVKKALDQGKTIREVVIEEKVLTPEEAERVLDPRSMIENTGFKKR